MSSTMGMARAPITGVRRALLAWAPALLLALVQAQPDVAWAQEQTWAQEQVRTPEQAGDRPAVWTVSSPAPRLLPVALHSSSPPLRSPLWMPDPTGDAAHLAEPRASGNRRGGERAVRGQAQGSRLRPALLASAGLALTGAAVAYWSTHKADAAYDRYLHSAGTRRQQRALDRAERFDRVAGAAFLVMEAGLVLTARFVFF